MKKERNPQELPRVGIHDVSEHLCNQCSLEAHLLASFEVGETKDKESPYGVCYELCFRLKNERDIPILVMAEELSFYPGIMQENTRKIGIGQNWEEVAEFLMYAQEEKDCKINFTLDKNRTDQDYTMVIPFRDERGSRYRQKFIISIRASQEDPEETSVDYILTDDPELL